VETEAGRKVPALYALTMKEEIGANFIQIASEELKRNTGINLDVKISPFEVFQDLRRRDPKMAWDLLLAGGIGPEVDPHMCFQYYISNMPWAADGKNEMAYNNPTVDRLTTQALTTTDRSKRISIYQEVERILFQDLPSVPIYNTPILFAVRDRVHDFRAHNSCQIFLTTSWNNIWVDKK